MASKQGKKLAKENARKHCTRKPEEGTYTPVGHCLACPFQWPLTVEQITGREHAQRKHDAVGNPAAVGIACRRAGFKIMGQGREIHEEVFQRARSIASEVPAISTCAARLTSRGKSRI